MSSLGIVLRQLPFLCAAGVAGFALGRVDARASKADDYELFRPMYQAPASTEYARWYPTTHLLVDQDFGSLPTAGGIWPCHEGQAGQSWESFAPACQSPRLYSGVAVLLPDSRVFLPDAGSGKSADSSLPSHQAVR